MPAMLEGYRMTDAEIAALDEADVDTLDMLKYDFARIMLALPWTGQQCQCPECKPPQETEAS